MYLVKDQPGGVNNHEMRARLHDGTLLKGNHPEQRTSLLLPSSLGHLDEID